MPTLIFPMLLVLMLGACASKSPPPPTWVMGDSDAYSNTQYLLGRGQAATAEEAKDRARADIAKVFQVAVSVASEDMQRFKTDGMDNAAGKFESQSSRRIHTRTEQVVRGIQIADLWHDAATGGYHVLAVLPRLQAATSLRQNIMELDETTERHIAEAQNNPDLFLRIATATLALESQQAREIMQKSLQIVDASGRGLPAQRDSAQLQTNLRQLLQRVKLAFTTGADAPSELTDIVAGALAHAGYLLVTDRDAEFTVHAHMSLTDLGQQEGWYWQRGNLEMTLTETANGRVRGSKHWLIKSSASNQAGAFKRAMQQTDIVLKQELGAAIINMAIGR